MDEIKYASVDKFVRVLAKQDEVREARAVGLSKRGRVMMMIMMVLMLMMLPLPLPLATVG